MIFSKIMKTKRKLFLPLQITHGEPQVQKYIQISLNGCISQTWPRSRMPICYSVSAGQVQAPLHGGTSGWAGDSEPGTGQAPLTSSFYANLLSNIPPFHLLVVTQTVLSEEI